MTDLVTANEYKSYKAIEHFKDDEKINALVTPISELVKRYCGTSFIDYYNTNMVETCLLYTSPSPRDRTRSRMPSSA